MPKPRSIRAQEAQTVGKSASLPTSLVIFPAAFAFVAARALHLYLQPITVRALQFDLRNDEQAWKIGRCFSSSAYSSPPAGERDGALRETSRSLFLRAPYPAPSVPGRARAPAIPISPLPLR